MTLYELIATASKGYPDELILQYHEQPNRNHGDTLAKFIAYELKDTFDEDQPDMEQILTAKAAIEVAIRDLEGVLHSLEKKEAQLDVSVTSG